MAKSKISPSANPGLEGSGTRAYSPGARTCSRREPVPVGSAHALLLDADYIRVLPILMLCLLLELRHRIFRHLAPLPVDVQANYDQIGAAIVVAGDSAQEELSGAGSCTRTVAASPLNSMVCRSFEREAGFIRGCVRGF